MWRKTVITIRRGRDLLAHEVGDSVKPDVERDGVEHGFYLGYLQVDHPLRDDPRFKNLVKRVGLPE